MNMITRHRPALVGIALAGCLGAATAGVWVATSAAPASGSATVAAVSQASSPSTRAVSPRRALLPPLTMGQAKLVAMATVPGTVALTTMQTKGSHTIYQVTVVRTDGSAVELDVDAGTGSVVRMVSDAGDRPEDRIGNHPEEDNGTTTVPEDTQRQHDKVEAHTGPQFRD